MMSARAGLGDLHSHLVPGVDDGARTIEDTLESVERLRTAGVRMAITTPHVDASLAHDRRQFEAWMGPVDAAWETAREAVERRFPDFELYRGHEVMVDVPNPDFSDPRLRLNGTSFVLIEWPRLLLPPRTQTVVRTIREAGFRPIIAHPERYHGMASELALAGEWRDLGAYLQVNHGSFVGRYGREAQSTAVELLRRGHVSYLSSDFHARSHLKIYLEKSRGWLKEQGAEEQLELLTSVNPWRVLADEDPLEVAPVGEEKGMLDRLKRWLSR
jgi:protein-tyrosine phosphatase